MDNALTRSVSQGNTPQSEPIPGREAEMAKNSAGGYTFTLDKWDQFRRFLILGTDGGTYYVKERPHTANNIAVVNACINEDGQRAVDMIVEISSGGLAPKNTQAIYALAIAASAEHTRTRQAANKALGKVCRTGTHLYQFAEFIKISGGRGWGRGLRGAFTSVLTEKPTKQLALHAVKYRQRDGWSYRDLLRLSHPKTTEADRNALFAYMTGKGDLDSISQHDSLRVIEGYLRIQDVTDAKTAVKLISEYNLPWEAVSDKLRKHPQVWEALLPHMGATALTRNLAAMARLDMLKPLSSTLKFVTGRLTDKEFIERSREHPVRFLDASLVHASGGSVGLSRGGAYTANQKVVDALDVAFKLAFGNVEPTGKRHYLGIDVSGSMNWANCAGSIVMTPMQGAAAMALVTAAVEPETYVAAFTGKMQEINITGKDTLSSALQKLSGLNFGSTDCAIPMIDAKSRSLEVDQFCVYTDNETWAGRSQPSVALKDYRKSSGHDAKLAVIGMTSTGFTIADPLDAGMMDFVGFDASTPKAISLFASG